MGRLPRLYTILLVVLVLALCVGAGIAGARYLPFPLGGIGVGLAAGALFAFLITRDFSRHPTR